MADYSCGRALDERIAREVLHLELEGEAVPAYSSDEAAAKRVRDELEDRGWRFEAVAAGAVGQVGGRFRGAVSIRVAKPGRPLETAPLRTAATFACASMSAVMAAFDLREGTKLEPSHRLRPSMGDAPPRGE